MASVIPFGQPILIGHHSEAADRRYRDRIHTNMGKGIEHEKTAKHWEARAEAAENNRSIQSDDPAATHKLAQEIARLEHRQTIMKEANKILRSKGSDQDKIEKMALLYSIDQDKASETLTRLSKPDFAGRIGYPDYALTNNGANIRRQKARLAELIATADRETTEYSIEGVKVVENAEDNRLQLFFDGKPDEETRDRLKGRGFKWARSVGAWQRQLNTLGDNACYYAVQAITGWNHADIMQALQAEGEKI